MLSPHSRARHSSTKVKPFVVTNALVHETGLKAAELRALHKHFAAQQPTADVCDRSELPARFAESRRKLSFAQYATGIGLLRSHGTPERRLQFLVGVYSTDPRDGSIGKDELFTMLKASANLDVVRKNAFEVDVKALTRVFQHVKRQLLNRDLGSGSARIAYDALYDVLQVPMKDPPVATIEMLTIDLDSLLTFWHMRDEAELHAMGELIKLQKTLARIPVFIDPDAPPPLGAVVEAPSMRSAQFLRGGKGNDEVAVDVVAP